MSRSSIFAFVEGIEADAYFFGQILRSVCHGRALEYRVRSAREIQGSGGGKKAILKFYRYARAKGKLTSTFGGKNTTLLFFLDKDVDDLRRSICRSNHVIYTQYYDVQNHIFRHADLTRGISAAVSIDEAELAANAAFSGTWFGTVARRWREWLIFCVFATIHKVPMQTYYRTSVFNQPLNTASNIALYETWKAQAKDHCNASADVFERRWNDVERIVDRHLSEGTYDIVFKGKWYAPVLELDLRQQFAGRSLHFDGFARRIASTLATTIDFELPWTAHFRSSIAALLETAYPHSNT